MWGKKIKKKERMSDTMYSFNEQMLVQLGNIILVEELTSAVMFVVM